MPRVVQEKLDIRELPSNTSSEIISLILFQNLGTFERAFVIKDLMGKSAEVSDGLCFDQVERDAKV